jgi:IclR family KDG regulon transcriptional repressor
MFVILTRNGGTYRMNETGQRLQSVERAMKVLECFSLEKPELSLGEIAQQTKFSKSTVHRILTTLGGIGYMKQNKMNQKYSLGFKFFHLGSIVIGNTTLRNTAHAFMEKLNRETSETITLSIVEEDERVCIDVIVSTEQIRNFVKVGQRNPLWTGSSGKVMLANLDEADRERILNKSFSDDIGNVNHNKLVDELRMISEQGYFFTKEERVKGTFAIAAPLFDYNGKLAGGITLAGPVQRMSDETVITLIEKVKNTAREISQALGH